METPKYDPSKGYGPYDKILLKGASAGRSWREISALTNGVIPALAAEARVNEILDARDPLTEAKKRLLLTDDLMQLKDVLMEKAVDFKSLDHAKPLISLLTLLDKRLADTKFDLLKAMTEINRAQAHLMLSAISMALERTFIELEARHTNIQKSELTEIYHLAMPDVVQQIESRVPVD